MIKTQQDKKTCSCCSRQPCSESTCCPSSARSCSSSRRAATRSPASSPRRRATSTSICRENARAGAQRAESEEGGGRGLGHLGPREDGARGLESDPEGGQNWGPGHAGSPNWGQTSQEVRRLTSILSSFFWRCSSFTRCSIRVTRVSASSCCARSRRAAPRAPSPVRADAGVTVFTSAEVNGGGGASA